eukprot:5413709-Prymnesium_polylepis.1
MPRGALVPAASHDLHADKRIKCAPRVAHSHHAALCVSLPFPPRPTKAREQRVAGVAGVAVPIVPRRRVGARP